MSEYPKIRETIDELDRRERAGDLECLIVVFRTSDGYVCDRTAGEGAHPLTLLVLAELAAEGRRFYLDHERSEDGSCRPGLKVQEPEGDKP